MEDKERKKLLSDFEAIRNWVYCNLPIGWKLKEQHSSFCFSVTSGSMQSIVGTCEDWIKKLEVKE